MKADTIEELAEKLGMEPSVLTATVETHNKHCTEQTTDEWGSDPAALIPLTTAPYYATYHRSNVMGTVTGVVIDTDMHVVREDNTPVENLYAIGELTYGNYFNTWYPISGTAITLCISGGQLAAQSAIAEITAGN